MVVVDGKSWIIGPDPSVTGSGMVLQVGGRKSSLVNVVNLMTTLGYHTLQKQAILQVSETINAGGSIQEYVAKYGGKVKTVQKVPTHLGIIGVL